MTGTLIRGAQVITMDAATGSTPASRDIRIDGGVFTEIGTDLAPQPGDEIIDGTGMLVTPGFVNAHTHSWEYLYKGRYDNMPLELWMLYAYPILGGTPTSPDIVRLRTLMFAMESMKNGVNEDRKSVV